MSFYINYEKKNKNKKTKQTMLMGGIQLRPTCSGLHSRTNFFLQSFPMDEIIMMMGHSPIFHRNDEIIK